LALSARNTPDDWPLAEAWLSSWGPPRNAVVGESYRQEALLDVCPGSGCRLTPVTVLLQPEPDNPHDAHAIKAVVKGRAVGYLRADAAKQLAEALRRDVPRFVVAGVIRGGGPARRGTLSLGVHVWLDRRLTVGPEIVLEDAGGLVAWPPHDDELVALAAWRTERGR
jgi:hypothetical protein